MRHNKPAVENTVVNFGRNYGGVDNARIRVRVVIQIQCNFYFAKVNASRIHGWLFLAREKPCYINTCVALTEIRRQVVFSSLLHEI